MQQRMQAVLIEVVQFVPTLMLAAGFVLSGEVDLALAGPRFLPAAVAAVAVVAALGWRRIDQNPILMGSDLWLVLGALAFNLPIPPLAELLGRAGGAGLFAGALLAGAAHTALSARGYLGADAPKSVVRAASIVLLVLTALAMAWAWQRPDSVRLGAALPFILLNVCRRVLGRLATRSGGS